MGVHMEPKCSKFDYDERLLEKMIRLEHSTGLMIESFKKISTQIEADLADMKREFSDIKQQAITQRNSFQGLLSQAQTDLVAMKTEFAEMVDEQRKQANEAIESELTAHRKTIEDLKDLLNAPVHAFSATTVTNRSPSRGEILRFSDILLNQEDVYDVTTGKFTAPRNGTYAFTFSLCVSASKAMSFQIVVDGNVVSKEYYGDKAYIGSVSSYAVAVLNKGMKAWIQNAYTQSNSLYWSSGSGCWNRFSGHILH